MTTFTSGSTNSAAAETDLFATVVSDAYHACLIFLQNMALGDTMVFRVYVFDDNAGVLRLADTPTTISGQQSISPTLYVAPIATRQFKVTVQRTLGSDRAITWCRAVG